MLRLECFGGARLLHGDENPAPQRRRVGLLALLAVAADRGMSREKLVGYLWPESTVDNARHSLEQLVYAVRRAYGEDVLIGGNPLQLNDRAVTSDLGEFEKAIAAGNLDRAVELYRGSFLDGFFIPDAPEFERWATTEAQRLSEVATRAMEDLANRASGAGRHSDAIALLRKRASLDPTSARGATLLMDALAKSGDTTSALQHAAVYERLVRQELGSDPDPSVTALASELRAAPLMKAVMKPTLPAALVADEEHPPEVSISVHTAHPPWRGALGVGVLVTIAAIGYAIVAREPTASSKSERIAVVPFRTSVMDSSLTYLGEGMVDLLSARFTGEGGPEAVNPRAVIGAWRMAARNGVTAADRARETSRSVRASETIEGELVQTNPGQLTLNARLTNAEGKVLAQESVRGSADSIGSLSDQLANRLLASRAGEDARRLQSLLSEPNSAITAFLQGRSEYRHGNFDKARVYFANALDDDSTFAAAALELGLATGGLFQWSTVTTDTTRRTRGIAMGGVGSPRYNDWVRAINVATRDSARLSKRDRVLLVALRGGYPGGIYARQVLTNWENAAQALPDLPDAHFWLGHVLLFQGPAMGMIDSRARARAEFSRALLLDQSYAPARRELIEVAALDRDTALLKKLAASYLTSDSVSDEALYVQWRVAGIRDTAALAPVRSRFTSTGRSVLERIRLMSQLDGVSVDDAARANNIIQATAGSPAERQLALHAMRQIALNSGHPSQAIGIAERKRELEPNQDLQRGYAIRDALFWDGDTTVAKSAVAAFDQELSASKATTNNARRSSYMRFSTALWRLSHGDTTRVRDDIVALRRPATGRDPQALVLDAMFATITRRADASAALSRLDSVAAMGFGASPHVINLVSARLHEMRGETAAALAAVRRGRWYFPPENLTTYLRTEARLAQKLGDKTAAISTLTQYLALRSHPEAALKSQVDSARAELRMITRQN